MPWGDHKDAFRLKMGVAVGIGIKEKNTKKAHAIMIEMDNPTTNGFILSANGNNQLKFSFFPARCFSDSRPAMLGLPR